MAQEGIFTRFEDDDKIPGQVNIVSSGMWSGGIGTLTSFYTSSTQSGSTGEHYYDVYNGVVGTNATASVQFSVAYGNLNGSGSLSGDSNYKASQAVYSQLRNLLLTQNETQFKFGASSDTASNSIFAVAMNRTPIALKIKPIVFATPNLAAFNKIKQKAFHADAQKFFPVIAIYMNYIMH